MYLSSFPFSLQANLLLNLNKIAKAHGKSVVQIILRWHMQRGFIAIPGSSNPKHIRENINIFDFSLTDEEMDQINALNKEKRIFNVSLDEKRQKYTRIIIND